MHLRSENDCVPPASYYCNSLKKPCVNEIYIDDKVLYKAHELILIHVTGFCEFPVSVFFIATVFRMECLIEDILLQVCFPVVS